MKKNTKPNSARPVRPDFDPDLVSIRHMGKSFGAVHLYHHSFLSRGTIYKILNSQTKRPTHMTMTGIARAMGYEYKLVRGR